MSKFQNYFNKYRRAIVLFFSFIATFSTYGYFFFEGDYNIWLKNTVGSDVVWIIVGYGFWNLITKSLQVDKRYFRIHVFLLALFFSLVILIGHAFTLNGCLDMYLSKVGFLLFALLVFGFTIIFSSALLLVFSYLENFQINETENHWLYHNHKKSFYIIWAFIFCYYSVYLAQLYPGVIGYDSIVEINQFESGLYSNHHPFAHVILIHLMLKISQFFGGSLSTGIFFYSILQMFIMSGIFAYTLLFLIEHKVKRSILILLFLFYVIVPVQAVYSITMLKDVLFSGICLLIVITLIKLIYLGGALKNRWFFLKLGFLFLVLSVLRHNGFYAFVLFMPILLFMNKPYRKQLFIMTIAVFGIMIMYSTILLPALDVKKGSSREALSIPLQQIARTVKYHSNELTTKEKNTVKQLFQTDSIGLLYQPHISDFVKSRFDDDRFKKDSQLYINLWISLLEKYPLTYLESFIDGSYGYIDPNVNYGGAYVFYTLSDYESNGYSFVSKEPKNEQPPSKGNLFLTIPKLIFIHTPIISLITSIGFVIWIGLLFVTRCFLRKQYKIVLPFYFLGLLYLTVLASPMYAEYRYAYGIILSIPVLCCAVLLNNDQKQKK